MLDELLSAGEVVWSGHGQIGAADGWVAFHPADMTAATLPPPDAIELTPTMASLVDALTPGGALTCGTGGPSRRHRRCDRRGVGAGQGRNRR